MTPTTAAREKGTRVMAQRHAGLQLVQQCLPKPCSPRHNKRRRNMSIRCDDGRSVTLGCFLLLPDHVNGLCVTRQFCSACGVNPSVCATHIFLMCFLCLCFRNLLLRMTMMTSGRMWSARRSALHQSGACLGVSIGFAWTLDLHIGQTSLNALLNTGALARRAYSRFFEDSGLTENKG